jgi:UDP-3-O-[3-hydroxymyristoyl] N-acetylglucosamine deacetylase/3-hydroxyacyl-[acyl-carrier-protein] dehydratase
MTECQNTIASSATFEGIGLHTGALARITLRPSGSNTGIRFKRIDLPGEPVIPADADLVISTDRGTTLQKDSVRIYTIEHLLAALVGCGIDNVWVDLNGEEIPILDGSSRFFVEGIEKAGKQELAALRDYYRITEPLVFEDKERNTVIKAEPAEDYCLSVRVDYNSPALGIQDARMNEIQEFNREIAPNRTFCFFREIEYLAKNNLIKGGDISNAIVLIESETIAPEEISALGLLLGKDLKHVKNNGIGTLNNTELRFNNEPARHKLLDVVGDLALVGKPIKGHIFAERPGHSSNVAFAKLIKNQMKKNKTELKHFDTSKPAVYDIIAIMKMLPHRYPFLLIDRILEVDDEGIIALKNVTLNEPFFNGHFPGNPVFPGVLQVEAMAQAGGIFALHNTENPEEYSTYFMKIEDVRFKKKVIPGDSMFIELKLITPIRRGIVHMSGTIYVDGQVASQAVMMAQVIKDGRNG